MRADLAYVVAVAAAEWRRADLRDAPAALSRSPRETALSTAG
jgi:hypothetical protein